MSVMAGNILRGLALAAKLLAKATADEKTVETTVDTAVRVGERIYAHTQTVCPCCYGKGKVSRKKAIEIEMSIRSLN